MTWMNEHEIEDAARRYADHPILGPATLTLRNLVEWTNANSDGWPYWKPPGVAAAKLEGMIQRDGTSRYRTVEREDVTRAEYSAALLPIKAFRTKHGATFEIVEDVEQVKTMRELHAIVAADAARWNTLHEAWVNLSEDEQVALIAHAQKVRLEALRVVLRSESISYGELAELQGLAEYIEDGDVELLEAAGVPESPEGD